MAALYEASRLGASWTSPCTSDAVTREQTPRLPRAPGPRAAGARAGRRRAILVVEAESTIVCRSPHEVDGHLALGRLPSARGRRARARMDGHGRRRSSPRRAS